MREQLDIMIVDDERIIRESFTGWFEKHGHAVMAAESGPGALELLETRSFDILFVDIKMPGMDGIELLERIKLEYPDTTVVIITAYGSIESAVQAMKLGAADYLLKPFRPEQLLLVMEKIAGQKRMAQERDYLRGRLEKITRFDNIIGRSAAMERVFELIPEVAASDSSVLLTGETGTGKELVAKAIHAGSRRSALPFIAINCGAIPDTLLESELFGFQKGAFTGAHQARKGFFEVVSGGTLFLDEIGEISPRMQVDLLRVLEDKRIVRVGDTRPMSVDFRLVSATRRDLAAGVAAGTFRRDFYYRINVITIPIPPLRSRMEDIPLLVEHFLGKFSHETTKQVDRVSREAMELLRAYPWPGNVRELQNAIERAVVLSRSRVLGASDFAFLAAAPAPGPGTLREAERSRVEQALAETGWNMARTAALLGVNRTSLYKMVKRLGLARP